jgi:flavin-dependent dehydrogenase
MRGSILYDAVIVGAGPAGLLCGRLMVEKGYRVLVIEARPEIDDKVCGAYLCPAGVELLKAMDLLPAIESFFEPVHGMVLSSPDGQLLQTYFAGADACRTGCRPYGLSLDRRRFDGFLAGDYLHSGGELIFGQRLIALAQTSLGWSLKTSGGYAISTPLLIGADGRKSLVSRHLGLSRSMPHRRIAVHAPLQSIKTNPRMGEMHLFDAADYIGLNPVDDGLVNVSWVCRKEDLEGQSSSSALRRRIQQSPNLRNRFAWYAKIETLVTCPITHRVRGCVGPQAALIGDASGFVDPLTGEGIYVALKTASMLVACLPGPANQTQTALARSLRAYQRQRRLDLASKAIISRIFQHMIHRPKWCNRLRHYLAGNSTRGDAFIGLIGNVSRPGRAIWNMALS